MNQNDLTESVIPGLTRNPVVHLWPCIPFGQIPAFAGMTWLSFVFNLTSLLGLNEAPVFPDHLLEVIG